MSIAGRSTQLTKNINMIYLFFLMSIISTSEADSHIELGDVRWIRSMDEALLRSKSECKPILILFQEVPGCATCREYGSEVLSHPLIVEAIETHFIPLAIFNNKGGHDAEVLKKYNEPSWNNPVVRIVDEKGKDILSRLNGNYSAVGLAEMMTNVLIKVGGKAPVYLQLLTDELSAKKHGIETVTYSMHCFWTGEALFGKVNGVVSTMAGWENRKEVVKVDYNPSIISKSQLDKIASQSNCKISSGYDFGMDKTPKYYLSNHRLRSVPMTELQKARVNSAISEGQNAEVNLSPRQLKFAKLQMKENFVPVNFIDAWDKAEKYL